MFPDREHSSEGLLQLPFSLEILHPAATVDNKNSSTSTIKGGHKKPYVDAIPIVSASYRTRDDKIVTAKADDYEYVKSELRVDKLNEIHEWLKIVGRPMPPRALHTQKIKSREIIVTEQMDLHLVWCPKHIYIKPIPRFLLDTGFWEQHLCTDYDLYACAMGFLRSFTALIQYESDYRIAMDMHLLPSEVTWSRWVLLVEQLLKCSDRIHVNKRYIYGELRLGRLNLIYRLGKGRIRGFLNNSTTYTDFLQGNLKSLLTLFAYFTIVLSALQVGLGTRHLENNDAFNNAAYVVVVFSMAAPLLAIAVVMAFLIGLTFYNLVATVKYRKQRLHAPQRRSMDKA